MKKYLYCIQYNTTADLTVYPETIHIWFDEHPDDIKIREVINLRHRLISARITRMHYYMVYNREQEVPFVDEVELFNKTFGKPNNYFPTIPDRKEWEFVYNFILEELEEYKQACEKGDIVEVLDALCDITYVSLGNGVMLHGLKDKILPAYREVQASNMSKACQTEEEAKQTVEIRSHQQGEPCHYEKVGDIFVVYRTSDRKVMKSILYFKPDLNKILNP
jgi:hypothetical protein